MTSRTLALLLLAGCLSRPVWAARTISVVVDKKGSIRIPVATLRQLGVKPDRTGSIWIRFPVPAAEKPPVRPPHAGHNHGMPPAIPARVLVSVDRGQVVFARMRIGVKSHVPGPPGTKYLAGGSGNELILRAP